MTRSVSPYLRLQFGGNLGNPAVEIWSNGVNFAYTEGEKEAPSVAEINSISTQVATVLSGWFTNATSLIGPAASLTYHKLSWVLSNGKQRDIETVLHNYGNGVVGGAPSNPAWTQTYALTLRTDVTRGRGHSGRIYPPLSGLAPEGASPYCSAVSANGMATQFATALADIAGRMQAVLNPSADTATVRPIHPCVVSAALSEKGQTPFNTRITHVVVDRVADVQHRRVNRVDRLEGATAAV